MKATSEQLAIGILGVAAGLLASLSPAQSDTWWLLRAGQDIVSTRTVPLVDSYSFTAAGLYWPNHEWLTEVLFYLVHSAAGMPGLAALTALLIMSAAVMSWRLAEGAFELRFVAFGAALVASTQVFAIRPQVVTLAMFSLACLLLRRNRLWWLPLVILVWVNFHGAAVLGVIVVVAGFLSDVVSRWDTSASNSKLSAFSVVLSLSVLATLASPLGVRLWTFIPESTERSAINQLVEWSAPSASPQFLPFWFAVAALIVLTVLRWRFVDRDRRRIIAIALAVLPLAAQSMRNVPVFLLAAIPAITMLAAARRGPGASPVRSPRSPARGENLRLNGAILLGVAAVAAVAVLLIWRHPPAVLQFAPVSDAAATAIARCGSPLYNTYNRGGEIIWFVPAQKVFIDNRQDPYPPDLLAAARRAEQNGDFAALFDKYVIRCAALPPDSSVAARLRNTPGWTMQFEDAQWVILSR